MVSAIFGASLLFAAPSHASPSKEHLVKAAFIYNFTKFVKWPEKTTDFTICMEHKDIYEGALHELEKRSARGVTYKTLVKKEPTKECSFFIYGNGMVAVAPSFGVLSVSNGENFTETGGAVSFVEQGKRIKFNVNLKAVHAANLKIDPQLLEIANKVIR